jgi:hypothetical protein
MKVKTEELFGAETQYLSIQQATQKQVTPVSPQCLQASHVSLWRSEDSAHTANHYTSQ